jgi:hypothetical protein
LVLLPLEADEMIEVLKHYFGITFDNELVVRGMVCEYPYCSTAIDGKAKSIIVENIK